ncbi:hypothetical protein WR25_14282 [Diploscapter pachys]|uniref:PIH1 N-terminal domain-containing protein n=1 Tax=Diploscapter pachys TaxID=2018661 RepID=A0A2A2LVS6_9BILA|nr:hypothetical protein WR25_14282 [Diploscapter pachys]
MGPDKSGLKIEDTETWLVTPIPGYVLKFKTVKMKDVLGEPEDGRKCFINVCHCSQLPPPMEILDEDELAKRIDTGDYTYRIPLSVGELDCVRDHNNENSIKIDVLVNSVFYEKCLAPANAKFFQHFFAMVLCDAVQEKHQIELNPNKAIRLQNRRKMGEIENMRVKKKPKNHAIQEIEEPTQNLKIQEVLEDIAPEAPWNKLDALPGLKMRLFDGQRLEISMDLTNIEPPVEDEKRLRLDISKFDVRLLLDNQRSLYHFSVPLPLDPDTAKSRLILEKQKLVVTTELGF